MFKAIKISALVSFILLTSGLLFKNQHFLGANVIFILGVAAGVLASILIISTYLGKLTSGLEKFNIIFTSAVLAVVLLSFLFKIMYWPGAAKLIWVADIGIIISAVLFLVDGYFEKDRNKSILKILTMFFILFIFMLIVVMS